MSVFQVPEPKSSVTETARDFAGVTNVRSLRGRLPWIRLMGPERYKVRGRWKVSDREGDVKEAESRVS